MANEFATQTGAKDIVMSFINSLNKEDFETARKYASDDFAFDGVLGSRDGADAYFNDMKKMKLKYHIRKTFVNGDDVCLLYDLEISGVTLFGCGWYHVENGRINSLKVVFDPRPILELRDKK